MVVKEKMIAFDNIAHRFCVVEFKAFEGIVIVDVAVLVPVIFVLRIVNVSEGVPMWVVE